MYHRDVIGCFIRISFRRCRDVLKGHSGYNVLVWYRGEVPFRHLNDVPQRSRSVFYLKLVWDIVETYQCFLIVTYSWKIFATFLHNVVETFCWDVFATLHRGAAGCFIWDAPATLLGQTERLWNNVVTTSTYQFGSLLATVAFDWVSASVSKLAINIYFETT